MSGIATIANGQLRREKTDYVVMLRIGAVL